MFEKVFDKKKLNFWRLAFIFLGLTITILFFLWSTPQEPKSKMMGSSMSRSMRQMHLSNPTIYDILTKGETQNQTQNQSSNPDSHHQGQGSGIVKLNFLTTAIIFFLLPLIIGGSIILAIVWFK
jgi:hypothetical protein